MKPQSILRFALIIFAVSFAAPLHSPTVIQFAGASLSVAENVGQTTLSVQRTADLATADGTGSNRFKQFSRDRPG